MKKTDISKLNKHDQQQVLNLIIFKNKLNQRDSVKPKGDTLFLRITKFGEQVASQWDAELVDWEINDKISKIFFTHIKDGNKFQTELGYSQLKQYIK